MDTNNWLYEWLNELNLLDYHTLFSGCGLITRETLVGVDKVQLKEIGVTKPGHLNRLHKAIVKLFDSSEIDTISSGSSSDLLNKTSNPSSPRISQSYESGHAPITSGAPPIPTRRTTGKKRSPSPGYTSPIDTIPSPNNSKESSPLPPDGPPEHVPRRVHSLRKKSSNSDVANSIQLLPDSEELLLSSPTGSGIISPTGSGIISPEMGSSPVNESFLDPSIPDLTPKPVSPSRSPKRHYENVGLKTSPVLPTESKPRPKPPPRISSQLSTELIDDTPPPIVPPQRSIKTMEAPAVPKITSYDKILEGEVWSGDNAPPTDPKATTNIPTYESIDDCLPPALDTVLYEEISTNIPINNVPATENVYDRLSPIHSPGSGRGLDVTVATTEEPPMSCVPTFAPPIPPKVSSPPPVPMTTTSLPTFSPSPPPIDDDSLTPELPATTPSPPPVIIPTPTSVKPSVPNRKSSLFNDIDLSFLPPPPAQPPLPKPRPANRKSSLVSDADAEAILNSSKGTSPPPVPSPPPASSPPPSVSPPIPARQEEDLSLPPPPLPKRDFLNLPPPPPPPITYDDHPECMMQDPETYSTIDRAESLVDSPMCSGGDGGLSGSGTPGSPLTPSGSTVRIVQLSSGSEGCIGLTPPVNHAPIVEGDYSLLTDSDSDSSPYSTPSLSGASTLRDTMRSSLEPLKEDTLLHQINTYETVSPPPPRPKPRPRPQSTMIEEKKSNLFGYEKSSSGPREGLSMSFNSYHEASPPPNERVTAPAKRVLPGSQSVKDLAKDLEKQTLKKNSVMMRCRTDSNVTDGQSTISPAKYRVSMIMDVPPTVEGFLHKKGGKKNERPYQKRWVVFDGEELKYFRSKGEKESDARNNVKLSEMIDIKRVADPDQTNRFDLVVINRVFQFYSDTEDNAQLWVNVLHAAISKFNPTDDVESHKEGGNMNDPDKQGFLMKQGHGRFASGFRQRYVALKDSRFAYYDSKEDFVAGKPIHILDMRIANVKPDMTGKTCRFTLTMPSQRSYTFQATNNMERSVWIEKIQESILNALNLAPEKKEGKKGVRAADILTRIQENPDNKICADCSSEDPCWAIVNRGIMVCIECSGVHRSMGVHISKVRSVELDVEIWTETLIQVFQMVGNKKSNVFWEKHCQSVKLESSSPREIREMYIRTKYESKAWIPRNVGDTSEVLSKALCVAVAGDDLMRTTELLVTGADPCYVHPDIHDVERNTPILIARTSNNPLQVEILEQNGGLLDTRQSDSTQLTTAFRNGYLFKTGSDRQGWKKRHCTVNAYRGLEYFRTETDAEILGSIKVDSMLGISQCEIEGSGKDKYCFEIITPGRAYLFAAETEGDMNQWIDTIKEILPKDNADKLGYDKVGFLTKRSPQNLGWKKRWFSLKDKKLTYFKNSKEEISCIDMKNVVDIKGLEQGSFESMCSFQIVVPERVYHLKADNPIEADSWVQALKQTQVSVPLFKQPLTSGSGIPIIIHKCLQFIETNGLDLEGIYRVSGEKSKSRTLLQQFNQDPRGYMIDSSLYGVHEVTGTLKKFLRGLPDPVLTHQLGSAFLDASVMSDHESKLHQLQSLIDQLPPVNKETLKRIISHLLKVVQHESSNKMSQSNLTSLFGPTLMSVDGDPVNVEEMQSQYSCIEHMMRYYGWLFNADGEEEKKEEAMQEALKKLEAAKEQHKQQAYVGGMNTSTSFLISVHIGGKDGEVCGMKATLTTTAAEVVEFVTTTKCLPPTNYCVHLVLGDSESERPLHSLEQVLAVQTTDSYLCLKQNTLANRIKDYDSYSGQCVMLHVMEKKKWKRYPCAVKSKYFIIYKDNKCQAELSKIPLFDADLFNGIERKNIDVKNPLPTKYPLCLLVRVKDNNKFLCADSPEDRLLISAAVIFSKHPDGIQTPVMPVKTTPKFFDARNRGISLLNPSVPPSHSSGYSNYRPSLRTHVPKKNIGDEKLMKELTLRQHSTSPERS